METMITGPWSRSSLGRLLLAALGLGAPAAGSDVLYEALLGTAQPVEPDALMSTPGPYLGRVVRTQGRLEKGATGSGNFELAVGSGRALLKLEPEAASLVLTHAGAWVGRTVEVEGLFHRQAVVASADVFALRAWHVSPVGGVAAAELAHGDSGSVLPLEALVYGGGRYDGTLVRVRGSYRGSNVHDDLPESTRRSQRDWILKDGYFAAWVDGHEPPVRKRDAVRGARPETGLALDVVGIPSTSNGVVRIAAREVHGLPEVSPAVMSRALSTDKAAVPPRVSFAFPVAGQALSPRGHMIVQFSKPMDPARLERGVMVHFERDGLLAGLPSLKFDYRDCQRVLVITPDPPPPPLSDVVVDFLDAVVDVDGRRLVAGTKQEGAPEGVVERIRFQRGP
jgi:hypothetical protein